MSITRRKMPPYAKNFIFEDDLRLAVIYFGPQAWSARDQINSRSVILPPDERADEFDWRFLRGNTIICNALGETDKNYRRRLAFELLIAGAKEVMMMLPKNPIILCEGQNFEIRLDDYIKPKEFYVHNNRK